MNPILLVGALLGFLSVVVGALLFSFSIYAAALSGVGSLTYLTPVGGVTLMLAWLALAWAALAPDRRRVS